MTFVAERNRRNVLRMLLSVAVILLLAPGAHAIEGHCVMYCDTPSASSSSSSSSSSSGMSYADAVAYDLAGQVMAQAMQAGAVALAAAIEQAIIEEARREAARKAARVELLARQQAALDARNADRAQRERAHHLALADAGLRMESIVGDLMSQLGGPAAAFANFQFAGISGIAETGELSDAVASVPTPAGRVQASTELRFDRGTRHSAPVDLRSESVAKDRSIDPAEMKQGTPLAFGLEEKERIRKRWDRMAGENLERMRQETLAHEVRTGAEEDMRQEVLRQQMGDALIERALQSWQKDSP